MADVTDEEERASYERYKAAKIRVGKLNDAQCRDWLIDVVGAIWCALDDSSDISPRKHPADVFDKHILRGNVQMDGCDVVERGALEKAKAQGAAEERERLARLVEDEGATGDQQFLLFRWEYEPGELDRDRLSAWLRAGGKEPGQ